MSNLNNTDDVKYLLKSEAQELLIFGQIHSGTLNYFKNKVTNARSIPITSLPHYHYFSSQKINGKKEYLEYLKISWNFYKIRNNYFTRKKQCKKFEKLKTNIKTNGITSPIEVLERNDGKLIVIDGNHRSSIAILLDLPLPYVKKNKVETLLRIATNPNDFYGSKFRNMPYQSIYEGGEQVIAGRRKDLVERTELIYLKDLAGKNILDLGSNLGQALNLAMERGAISGTGVEGLPEVATAALRLNVFFNSNIETLNLNLNKKIVFKKKYETIFCFSVLAHVKNRRNLAETIALNLGNVLYIEGHSKDTIENYQFIIEKMKFREIKLLGHLSAGTHSNERDRPFWRLELES